MKKILFNDKFGLTQAVLDGRKTQTRRIIPNCTGVRQSPFSKSGIEDNHGYELKSKYHVGEVVAVAQAYREIARLNDGFLDDRHEVKDEYVAGWSNKLFVRADLMPNRIRITDARVERLNDISESDCLAEGVDSWVCRGKRYYGFFDYSKDKFVRCTSPREAYAALIDKISGKGTWGKNPHVFVYEFELVK